MIGQTQRWHRGPSYDKDGHQTDEGGDCFAACLASILELPIDDFPNFLDSRPYGGGGWWHRWQMWLYENYRAELIWWTDRATMPAATELAWWIAGVPCGNTTHAVVFYKDEFRWDPAPEDKMRNWSLDDVIDGVGLFSIGSIYDRENGPYIPINDADGIAIQLSA
jgi:hypothetical protein